MENKMENEMETQGPFKGVYRDIMLCPLEPRLCGENRDNMAS